MNDTGRVSLSQSARGLQQERDRLLNGQRPILADMLGDALSLDVLHDQESAAIVIEGVVSGDNVRMRQSGKDLDPRAGSARPPPADATGPVQWS